MRPQAVWVAAVFLLAACATVAQDERDKPSPPLPPEVGALWERLGPPTEIHPGVAMVLVWRAGKEALYVFLAYDPFRGWLVLAYALGFERVPSRWIAEIMAEQARRRREAEAQRPGEGFR